MMPLDGLRRLTAKARDRQGVAHSFLHREDGTSAIEFGIVGPVICLALVAAVDLGFAAYERMTIDHVLRAGAQSAIAGQSDAQVLKVLQTTSAKNFGTASPLSVTAERYCACPEAPSTPVGCLTICAASEPPAIFVRVAATRTYAGMIVPNIAFSPSKQVQIR